MVEFGRKKNFDEVIEYVNKNNPKFDQSYIIGVDFGDGSAGHVFNLVKENGVIKVFDSQGDNVLKQIRDGDYDDDIIFTIYKSLSE